VLADVSPEKLEALPDVRDLRLLRGESQTPLGQKRFDRRDDPLDQ
jgi:hypothetical protein